jgi:hypothetical protein
MINVVRTFQRAQHARRDRARSVRSRLRCHRNEVALRCMCKSGAMREILASSSRVGRAHYEEQCRASLIEPIRCFAPVPIQWSKQALFLKESL